MNVFDALSRHVNWASERYAVAAQNVANLDTPGYRAKEVSPFELEVNATAMRIMQTSDRHLSPSGPNTDFSLRDQKRGDETHSLNNVSIENEMRTVGESVRAVSSSTALYKLFHRMTIAASKG